MATAGPMATPTEAHILTLVQWLSPAFPIGAFAYSHGLEAAVDIGRVRDAEGFEAWLGDVLDSGAGRSDALFLAAAYHAQDSGKLASIDALARAFSASAERLLEAQSQGSAFCKLMNAIWSELPADLLYPVALGAAAGRESLPLGLAASMYLQAFASNMVAAAQRLLPMGQTEGQAILRRQARPCTAIAVATADGDLSRLSGTAFLADIAAMRHETQHTRIFRT